MLKYEVYREHDILGYFRHADCHRKDGPSWLDSDGLVQWSQYGKVHRKDGPAIKFAGGGLEYWIRGVKLHAKI